MTKVAKIYGNRWELDGSLGAGGQGDVFRAFDITLGSAREPVALKRLKNRNRADRFIREIEAIRSVEHPHVIKLLDHSPLGEIESSESLYLVMPIAAGGDLSNRAAVYKNSLDSTLIVAQQLALALAAAHNANVIHRDVKPQNILFRDEGNHAILTDFGICYTHEEERITPLDEAVGPRVFMAPEMEGGRVIDVRPAADIYSLGKVIFYMISGGFSLPREAIHDEPYSRVFSGGERYHLLRMLLSKMICVEGHRLQTMPEVIAELEKISSWESRAQITPLSPAAIAAVSQLQQSELNRQRIAIINSENRKTEEQLIAACQVSWTEWLRAELLTKQ
jgi:serine/threonine protein kinase